jgi:hypothetical protein
MEAVASSEILVSIYQTTRLHIQKDSYVHIYRRPNYKFRCSENTIAISLQSMMEAVASSEILVSIYQTTRLHIQKDSYVHIYRRPNYKFRCSENAIAILLQPKTQQYQSPNLKYII